MKLIIAIALLIWFCIAVFGFQPYDVVYCICRCQFALPQAPLAEMVVSGQHCLTGFLPVCGVVECSCPAFSHDYS